MLSHTRATGRIVTVLAALAALLMTTVTPASAVDQTISLLLAEQSGQSPFDGDEGPGLDTDAENDVVRTLDLVTYTVAFASTNPDGTRRTIQDAVLRQDLPAGLTYEYVPGFCKKDGSSLSADGRTLTCALGSVTMSAGLTFSFSPRVQVAANGTRITPAADSVVLSGTDSGSGEPISASASPKALTVSASPKINLTASPMYYSSGATSPDGSGTEGYYAWFDVGLSVPYTNGTSVVGFQAPDQPIGFDLDLSQVSPHAQLAKCNTTVLPQNRSRFPGPQAARGQEPTASQVRTSGTLDCTQTGSTVTGSWSGLDLSLAHIPATTLDGTKIGDRAYVAVTVISVFIPYEDLPSGVKVNLTGSFSNIVADAQGADGTTVANTGEITTDNVASGSLTRTAGGSSAVAYRDFVNGSYPEYVVPQQSLRGTGLGVVVPGQQFQARVQVANQGGTTWDDLNVCVAWDNATQQPVVPTSAMSLEGGLPDGQAAWVFKYSAKDPNQVKSYFRVEYSTTNAFSGTDEQRYAAMNSATCGDADGNWSATMPADPSTITRARFIATKPYPAGWNTGFTVNLEAKPNATGTVVPVTYSFKTSGLGWASSWVFAGKKYAPATHTTYPNGDRLLVGETTTGIAKSVVDPAPAVDGSPVYVEAGSDVEFSLRPAVTSTVSSAGTAKDVVVRDLVPAGMSLVTDGPDAPSLAPATIEKNAAGTLVTWNLGTVERGSEPVITYHAALGTTSLGSFVNRAIVHSSSDPSSLADFPAADSTDVHYAWRNVVSQAGGGIQVSKEAAHDVVEVGDPLGYRVVFANLEPSRDAQGVDVIDVLPYAGDSVARGSVFAGSHVLAGAPTLTTAADDGTQVADPESVVTYSTDDPATIVASQQLGETAAKAYGAGITWSTEAELGGDLTGITAIRVTRPTLAALQAVTVDYTLLPTGTVENSDYPDRSGDLFANDVTMRTADFPMGVRSNAVRVKAVASSIGDVVWGDTDRDGIQDADEPGIAGVSVRLTGTDKNGLVVDRTTTTDDDGRYLFGELVQGTYVVDFSAAVPESVDGWRFSPQHVGDDRAADSDADPATGLSSEVVVTDPIPSGRDGLVTQTDAGLYRLTSGLVASKTSDPASGSTVERGSTVTYTLTARNTGELALDSTTVTDDLVQTLARSAYNDDISATRGEFSIVDGHLTWLLSLEPGDEATLTYSVTVATDAPDGRWANVVVANGSGPEAGPVPSNCVGAATPECSTEHDLPELPVAPVDSTPTGTPTEGPTDAVVPAPATSPGAGSAAPEVTSAAPAPAASTTAGEQLALPTTGGNPVGPLLVGAALLALGAGVLVLRRRHHS